MADKEEGHPTAPRGADWEVVSLTASAYAAAPGGDTTEVKLGEKGDVVDTDKVETSNALFMSGHFVLPPNHHETSTPEPERTEILGEQVGKADGSESVKELGGKSDANEEENWNIKKLSELDDFHGIPFSHEKSNRLAFSDADITENTALSLGGKEQSIYCSPKLHSLHSEATMGTLNLDDETSALDESVQSSDPALVSNIPNLPENTKEDDHGGSGMPSAAWWKKQAACLYAHAKETNTFWSIFAAAAVMGILVIGRQERWQVLCHEWKSRIHDERMRMLAGPISRFKEAIVGGNRQDFSIRGSTSRER
ncbi:hypothetical protein L6452_36584 [Arctium lappa]|uniref:Uncharacterized protein n=1 Tax=Arctium lappa TaxID=4217 RepID=A0ACB8Y9J0_ARCLA|nr:hypothetical protein L6452_36584 [Arctium lappa]